MRWLSDTGETITTACGKTVPIFQLKPTTNRSILSAWARHFRNHYCLDSEIDRLRQGTPHSRADYLRTLKFPDRATAPGPSIRSGDFSEVLVADFVQYNLNYWVPRTRYNNKAVRNESTKGTDILGFKLYDSTGSERDILAMFEAKGLLSGGQTTARLQDAVNDSVKDELRKAESLNALKQRLLDTNDADRTEVVERFQDPVGRPYTSQFGAVAVISTGAYSEAVECTTDSTVHPNCDTLFLLLIKGDDLMTLTHALYERAADEA